MYPGRPLSRAQFHKIPGSLLKAVKTLYWL
jgi:hypothetical protein